MPPLYALFVLPSTTVPLPNLTRAPLPVMPPLGEMVSVSVWLKASTAPLLTLMLGAGQGLAAAAVADLQRAGADGGRADIGVGAGHRHQSRPRLEQRHAGDNRVLSITAPLTSRS